MERRLELVMMSFDVCKSLTPICLFSANQTERSGCYLFFFLFFSKCSVVRYLQKLNLDESLEESMIILGNYSENVTTWRPCPITLRTHLVCMYVSRYRLENSCMDSWIPHEKIADAYFFRLISPCQFTAL